MERGARTRQIKAILSRDNKAMKCPWHWQTHTHTQQTVSQPNLFHVTLCCLPFKTDGHRQNYKTEPICNERDRHTSFKLHIVTVGRPHTNGLPAWLTWSVGGEQTTDYRQLVMSECLKGGARALQLRWGIEPQPFLKKLEKIQWQEQAGTIIRNLNTQRQQCRHIHVMGFD